MIEYKKTLKLPKTSFPMKANLAQNEPQTLKFWEKTKAYEAMTAASDQDERFVLHDGPPYANGNIHMGTALNKVLKDIIVKHKNFQGFKAEYVPGWDCHGLPIEHKVAQELRAKGKTNLPALTVRKICRDYAAKFVKIMREEFKRLGVFGVWEEPYLTMNPGYEAATARELGEFMARGGVRRSKKPIHWCIDCRTALAEAEVEYADHSSPSIYVRFPLPDPKLAEVFPQAEADKTFIIIWTTTPWTLPSNMGVAVHPEFEYVLVKAAGAFYILAEGLLETCAAKFGWEEHEVVARAEGSKLEGLTAMHPFYDRDSKVVLGDYVTLDTGTGCVHTAPGHGREDYETGLKYGLEVLSPLDDGGRFLPSVEFFSGSNIFEANPEVIKVLQENDALLAHEKIGHSYPHCWRCKSPVIFRATTQWFISMESNDLRKRALSAIENDVRWIPAWGRERIYGMIESRPDWCISRQRTWGVPIVALLCKDCDGAWFDGDWVKSVTDKFKTHERGCDYWFEAPLEEVVPEGLTCSCGGSNWEKEDDILDVWFDSGTSFSAVVEQREECRFPADMYLEGSDQHRGWFHSSLLASIGTRDVPPYKAVLTHGYVVDGEGKKMSKSVGNVVAPKEVIEKYGADILRLWVSAENYQDDIRYSDEIISRIVDAYRRIRNTCRFLLSNLGDYSKETAAAPADMLPADRYALTLVAEAHDKMQKAYDEYEFHKVYHTFRNLCVTQLSSFYLDFLKDRLYASANDDAGRRSALTALREITMLMILDMAPVLSFTAEEIWKHLPDTAKPENAPQSVFGLRYAIDPAYLMDENERRTWDVIAAVRAESAKAMEPVRKSGDIGHSLDAHVEIFADEKILTALQGEGVDLREIFIVSKVSLGPRDAAPEDAFVSEEMEGLAVRISPAPGSKCERCWIISEELGTDERHQSLCPRCTAVLEADGWNERLEEITVEG